jgi:hypothetical protein
LWTQDDFAWKPSPSWCGRKCFHLFDQVKFSLHLPKKGVPDLFPSISWCMYVPNLFIPSQLGHKNIPRKGPTNLCASKANAFRYHRTYCIFMSRKQISVPP